MFDTTYIGKEEPYTFIYQFRNGRYFKRTNILREIIDKSKGFKKITGHLCTRVWDESNLPIKEFIALRYWIREGAEHPIPRVIHHLFEV